MSSNFWLCSLQKPKTNDFLSTTFTHRHQRNTVFVLHRRHFKINKIENEKSDTQNRDAKM